jgi:hypothetical protein
VAISPNKVISMIGVLLLILLTSACSRSAITQERVLGTKQSAESQEIQNPELQNQLAQIASSAKGRVGIAAVVLEEQQAAGSGHKAEVNQTADSSPTAVSLNPHDHFPMQSV